MTIPGVAELLGLTLAAEIGDISRFPTAREAGRLLRPRAEDQAVRPELTHRSASRRRAPSTLRWAADRGVAGAWRPTTPGTGSTPTSSSRHGKANPAKAAVARKVLIAAWHVLSRQQPFKPERLARPTVPASSSIRLAA